MVNRQSIQGRDPVRGETWRSISKMAASGRLFPHAQGKNGGCRLGSSISRSTATADTTSIPNHSYQKSSLR